MVVDFKMYEAANNTNKLFVGFSRYFSFVIAKKNKNNKNEQKPNKINIKKKENK